MGRTGWPSVLSGMLGLLAKMKGQRSCRAIWPRLFFSLTRAGYVQRRLLTAHAGLGRSVPKCTCRWLFQVYSCMPLLGVFAHSGPSISLSFEIARFFRFASRAFFILVTQTSDLTIK